MMLVMLGNDGFQQFLLEISFCETGWHVDDTFTFDIYFYHDLRKWRSITLYRVCRKINAERSTWGAPNQWSFPS